MLSLQPLSKLMNLPRNIPCSETAKAKAYVLVKPDTFRIGQMSDVGLKAMLVTANVKANLSTSMLDRGNDSLVAFK